MTPRVVHVDNPRRHERKAASSFDATDERLQPARFRHGVVVEQRHESAARLPHTRVVATGKSAILGQRRPHAPTEIARARTRPSRRSTRCPRGSSLRVTPSCAATALRQASRYWRPFHVTMTIEMSGSEFIPAPRCCSVSEQASRSVSCDPLVDVQRDASGSLPREHRGARQTVGAQPRSKHGVGHHVDDRVRPSPAGRQDPAAGLTHPRPPESTRLARRAPASRSPWLQRAAVRSLRSATDTPAQRRRGRARATSISETAPSRTIASGTPLSAAAAASRSPTPRSTPASTSESGGVSSRRRASINPCTTTERFRRSCRSPTCSRNGTTIPAGNERRGRTAWPKTSPRHRAAPR